MPDVLHFDIDKALEAMLQVFWNKGYKSTTTKDLAKAAGLSESSLYNTFGSKRETFTRALDHYGAWNNRLMARLDRSESALEGIREYWRFICRESAKKENARGCLITNSTLELSDDPEIRAALAHNVFTAEMARRHNDAQVLCLGARVIGVDIALAMIDVFLATSFEGGRHADRVDALQSLSPRAPRESAKGAE